MRSCLNRSAWRRASIAFTLAASAWIAPGIAVADPIAVGGGSMGIWSDGGDNPSVPDPLLEFLFYFPLNIGNLESTYGDAYPTSAVHGSRGGLQVERAPLPNTLTAGSVLSLSTSVGWTNGGMTDGVIAGCCFETRSYRTSGAFSFVAGDAVLQLLGDQLVGYAPFTFTGMVNAFDGTTGAPLFERRFYGQGQTTFYYYPADYWAAHPERGAFGDFFVYVYDVEPVPEPATMLLLGGGLGLLTLRHRRRARR